MLPFASFFLRGLEEEKTLATLAVSIYSKAVTNASHAHRKVISDTQLDWRHDEA